jgi:hypothetical protein
MDVKKSIGGPPFFADLGRPIGRANGPTCCVAWAELGSQGGHLIPLRSYRANRRLRIWLASPSYFDTCTFFMKV